MSKSVQFGFLADVHRNFIFYQFKLSGSMEWYFKPISQTCRFDHAGFASWKEGVL